MIKLFSKFGLILFFSLYNLSLVQAGQIIKFATLAPEGSTWLKIMHQFNKAVQEETNGEVQFNIYPGGIAGDEKDVVRKIRFNQYHSGGFTGVGLGEILPAARVLDSPLLFSDYEEIDYIYEVLTPFFESEFEKRGYILIGWTQVGFVYIFSKKQIQTVADLQKVKMWTWEGDPISSATFNALGISPVPLSIADVLTSLQTNLIDAIYSGPLACVSLQWFTKVAYIAPIKLSYASGAVLVSKKIFDRLSPEHQKIVKHLGKKHFHQLVLQSRKDDEKSLQLMREHGLKTLDLKEEARLFFEQAGKKARQELAAKLYPKDLLQRIERELKNFQHRN